MDRDDFPVSASPGPEQTLPELLRVMLKNRDMPCPLCAYNLRNLDSGICPECGGELTLNIGLIEARMRAYITILVACCVGLGGSMLFGLVALAAAPLSWWAKTPALVLIGQLVLTSISLPIVLLNRARFRRCTPGLQRALALAMCGAVAILSLLFVATFKDR